MTYNEYIIIMQQLLVVDSVTETNYVAILPSMINYAENRILRELDLITTVTEGTVITVNGTRTVTVPSSIQIVQSAAVISPVSTLPAVGTRNPLQRVSMEFLNFIWPDNTAKDLPQYYSMLTDTSLVLAPTPDGAYYIACLGPVRPTALALANQTTWISLNIPDVFIAASMVFGTGWQRDFGAQANDPQASMSWEMQYQTLVKSADVDDARRKAQSLSWQPFHPEPLAKESRT